LAQWDIRIDGCLRLRIIWILVTQQHGFFLAIGLIKIRYTNDIVQFILEKSRRRLLANVKRLLNDVKSLVIRFRKLGIQVDWLKVPVN